ncbi:conserved hypothetical protein [Xenorhabdus innexi]|uniref:Uncharacterized protein n=1 Tax=Xenorhabdus innexi TaxID=290109 RepID=A0A1N6MUF7_9GAMM|nr:conserved hypothetical protein [Xenorhabdus innexi]
MKNVIVFACSSVFFMNVKTKQNARKNKDDNIERAMLMA